MKNHLSPQISEQKQKPWHYDVGNPGAGLGQAQQCGRVKPLNGIPTLLNILTYCNLFCQKRTAFS